MKTVFLEARSDKKVVLPKDLIDKLPKKIALFTTVQFLDSVPNIIEQIENKDKKVLKLKPKHCAHECQILGCSIEKFKENLDAFLYIGDGLFHPKALMLKNDKPVYVYNPFSKKHFELTKKDTDILRKKQKGAILKFHSSNNIGILLTVKSGQYNPSKAKKLKKKYPGKNYYMLLSDTIDFNSLEDFPFVECFVNTACPRIGYDDTIRTPKTIVDVWDLVE